jgi:transcriptional regulator with XRE-family HTH domain
MFLKLSSQIEGQLREAYAKKHEAGQINQSALAEKLGVDRSAVHRRLNGRVNMTEETIADMIWGLDLDIDVKIFDPVTTTTNSFMGESQSQTALPATSAATSNAAIGALPETIKHFLAQAS